MTSTTTGSIGQASPGTTSGTTRKRKAPAGDDGGAGRAVKPRAARACKSCRARKVRCDVLTDGVQCTNCRLDHIECLLLDSERGKNGRRRNRSTQELQAARALPSPDTVADGHREVVRCRPPVVQQDAGEVPVCFNFDADPGGNATESPLERGLDGRNPQASTAHETIYGGNGSSHCPVRDTHLPNFVTPLPSHLAAEDVEFLVRKGALTVPPADLRATILQSYCFCVHPFMPVLDVKDFLHAVLDDDNTEGCTVSLLLFQAVMFAGLCSLDMPTVHRLGFGSTRQAREAFFRRTRMLYDFDVEPDSTAIVQSLLLMSAWYCKWDEAKHTWYWTGLALSTAQSMGLHREPTRSPEKARRLRRRLWWSLYIRDRVIALGTRRPMRIQDGDFEVSMLSLQDFDIENSHFIGSTQAQTMVHGTQDSTRLALMCIELAKLCVCIGHVLSTQYTSLDSQSDVPYTMMVVPRRTVERMIALRRCDGEISEWLEALAPNIRRDEHTAFASAPSEALEVHWTMLNMHHLTLVSVLHRAQALPTTDTADARAVQAASRLKVRDAARKLTKFAHAMIRRDQVRYLSISGITALVSASLSHLLDIRSSGDEDVRDASIFRFYQSMQVLQTMRDIYPSADAAMSFLASVVREADISIPAPAPSPMSAWANDIDLGVPARESAPHTDDRRQIIAQKQAGTFGSAVPAEQRGNPRNAATALPHSTVMPGRGREVLPASQNAPDMPDHGTPFSCGATDTRRGIEPCEDHIPPPRAADQQRPVDPAADELFFGWNGSMNWGADFESMAFDYNFFPSALESFDDQLQGLR